MLKTRSLLTLALGLCAMLGAQEAVPRNESRPASQREAKLPESRPSSEARYTRLGDLPGVQAVMRFSDRLVRGAQPQGVQGMLELKKLGVSTILSVEEPDQPELDAAKEAGLKVINIPTEYNGFPDELIKDLVSKYRALEGTTYVHCHHGKHRGGTASAIFRMTFEGVPQLEALQEMAEGGCSKRYPGLYDSVRKYRPDPKTAHRVLKPRPGIDGLIEVTPWIFRGTSRLDAGAVAAIKDLGVRTVVSTGMSGEAESRVLAAGLAVTIVAIDSDKALSDERQAIVKTLVARKGEKIFLHATDDPAQVAAMVGAFRLGLCLWTREEAAREAEALLGLRGAKLAEAIRNGVALVSK